MPQYKIAIKLTTGDYCAFNVHEWHCNSDIIYKNSSSESKAAELLSSESKAAELLSSDSFRMSFVFYLRDKLEKCRQINGNLEKIVGNLEGKQWSSDILYKEIFKNCEKKYTSNKWWEMRSERYILEYKNKRYRLFDLEKDVVIHNLMNAWEYISNHHRFLMDDD